jgi:hypothetical protein
MERRSGNPSYRLVGQRDPGTIGSARTEKKHWAGGTVLPEKIRHFTHRSSLSEAVCHRAIS